MKIQCQSCQAKYTIADEKVLGKVVKIRCKKCSSTIVINGNEQAASASSDAGAGTDVFDYASGSNEPWTVNVADGDQRTMTIEEIVAEYKTGVVNDETYCWKDGMADWLPLREVEQIASAVKGGPKMAEEVSISPQSVPPPSAGLGGGSSGSLFGTGGGGDSPFAAAAHTNGNGNGGAIPTALFGGGAAAVEQSAPAAARRAGGRGQGGDLFGNVEKAGAEDDVMTSAAGAGMAAGTAEEKLTGQRNENSVLFSLSSLTDKKDAPPAGGSNRTTATADGSGLIDIRALSANMDEGDKKRKDTGARVDDIMNLSGGGAFGAALAAPILAPPPLETVDLGVSGPSEQPKQNKTLLFAILGGCAFIAIAIVAVAMMMKSPAPETRTPGSGAAPDTTGTATSTVAANDTSAPPATTTAAPAATDTPPPPGTGAKGATAPAGARPGAVMGTGKTGGGAVAAAEPAAPAPAPAPAAPKSFQDQLDEAAGKHSAPAAQAGGGGSTAPFDRGAASASLSGINVSACKSPGGPTGQGHVTVTFLPDGSVQSAVVDQGPFPGTTVAGCVAGRFRGAHVPPFGGAPVRVGKSFSIN